MMRTQKNQKLTWPLMMMGASALMIFLSLMATNAAAQVNTSDLLQPYRDFKPAEDMATRLMEGLLGATYTSPFTAGITTNTMFGAIFLVFNVIVFAVGTVWASYGVTAGIVQTAHEGVVLGKRMSAVWMPVRMVTGIGGLVPAFGGFSLSQVVMIVATSWGISFANFAYNEGLKLANSSATLVNASFSRVDPNKDANAMAQALFKQRMCEMAYQRKYQDYQASGIEVPASDIVKEFPYNTVEKDGTVVGRAVGTDRDRSKCYAVGLKRKTFLGMDSTGRSGSSMFGFRSGAVNYESINDQAWLGYSFNFPELVSRIRQLAEAYQRQVDLKKEKIPYPSDEIRAIGVWYAGAVQMNNFNHQNISQEALANMGKYGFFSAGSYYSTHAEVNAAVMQAADATDFLIWGPNQSNVLTSGEYDTEYNGGEAPLAGQGAEAAKKTSWCIIQTNDTGNCSIGQKFVDLMLDAGTAGAGGSSTMVDPIIALKNIGDYMMTLGESILVAVTFTQGDSVQSTVAKGVFSAVSALPIVGDLLKGLGAMAPYIGGLLFSVGALCAIYIPMVPFINWVSGLVQYCCIVVESFAAAPLWAFAHLQAEGEGMGQRTEKGYLYLLNLLFRPILMVVAFFGASALVIMLGSLVMQMYLPAMASAQGNSVTGVFSAIGYVFLFFVIMNIIIQGLFHLVMELADDAIGWVGGIGRSNIGRDTEGKVSNMFMMGGRFGSGGVDRVAGAAKASKAASSGNPGNSGNRTPPSKIS